MAELDPVALAQMSANINGSVIRAEFVEIDPELAELYLGTMPPNRTLKKKKVAGMVRSMEAGDFPFCADPIRFVIDEETGEEVLADGEHRLRAIWQSGTTQTMLIVWGMDASTRLYYDQVTPRSAADQIKMTSGGVKKYTQLRSGLVVLLMRWERDDLIRNAFQPTVPEVVHYADSHEEEVDMATDAVQFMRKSIRVGTSATGASFVMAYRRSPAEAIKFWETLATGAEMPAGSPVSVLRNALMVRQVRERWTGPEQVAAYVRFWNAMRQGQTVAKLQLPTQLGPHHFRMI